MTQLFSFVDDLITYADSSLADGVYMIDNKGKMRQLIFVNRPMPQSFFKEIKAAGYRIIMAGPMNIQGPRCFYSCLIQNEAA